VLPVLLTTLALAAPPDTGKHVFFTGDAGVVNASGNSDFTSVSVGNKLTLLSGGWKFSQTFGVTYARTRDSVTAEQWQGSIRGERALAPRVGVFLLTELGRNTFAGVSSRVTASFGVTTIAARGPHDTLRVEVGGGYAYQGGVAPDTTRHYLAGRAALIYHRTLGTKAGFWETFEYIPNFAAGADYRINSETAITAPISARIAMKASYIIHYEGLPEAGFQTTDRVLTTGVQVTF
jgi:putative salt-induced outer membrane protein YdiY